MPSPVAVAVLEVDVVIGTSPAVVASVEEDGEVVSVSADVDEVVTVEVVEIPVLRLVIVVLVLSSVSERETGTTSMPAPESAVLVVFLKGAICRYWLFMINLALTVWIYADLQLARPIPRERTSRGEG